MTQTEIPRFARDLLSSCPAAGSGVHTWLFRCARYLHAYYPDKNELAELLSAAAYGCGREIPRREILAAVNDSEQCAWQPGHRNEAWNKPQPRWPEPMPGRINEIVKDGPGLVDLWELSPWRIENNENHTEAIIDKLFPGNPLLCVGKSESVFDTKPREDWRGTLSTYQLIVPSPMSKPTGTTKDGKQSAHSLDNTGPRRFLVVEFDQMLKNDALVTPAGDSEELTKQDRVTPGSEVSATLDQHAGILLHLASMAPMAMALHSGGKSIHGWFFCEGQAEDKLHAFMRYAVTLGADPRGWVLCQFMRMPDGTRDNGKRQTVYFFNPGVIKQ